MKKVLLDYFLYFVIFCSFLESFSQKINDQDSSFFGLEYSFGKATLPPIDYPNVNFFNGIGICFGKTNYNTNNEWVKQLNFPKNGVALSYSSIGNQNQLGSSISIIPYLDFKLFPSKTDRLNCIVGVGASYFDTTFDVVTNPKNKVISTSINWAFRSHLYYKLFEEPNYNLKLGLGVFHNSNGHLRLPNNGLNVLSFQALSEFGFTKKEFKNLVVDSTFASKNKYLRRFATTRIGIGQKVFSKYSIDKQEVFTYAASTGKIINKTFQYGFGFSYRLYEDYYKYIKNEEKLVKDLYPSFKTNPIGYASSFSIFGSGEVLLSHIGIEMEIGFNLYKPAYKIDWQINEETYENNKYQLGELNWYYHLKRTISGRLGAKLYAVNTNKSPKNNFFLGTFINSNFGQADFSELTLGYVYSWKTSNER